MMSARTLLFGLVFALLLLNNAHAYFNVTYLNTTVAMSANTSAKVIETVEVFVSNSSESQYLQDRGALNLSLSGWQQALGTSLLTQHIFKSSISNYSLLPGPLIDVNQLGGTAYFTMTYTAYNVTTVANVAPRRFEYTFDDAAFNFEHQASGQVLPSNARLNVIVPKGSEVVSIYPLPDSPAQSFAGNYSNVTTFSWDAGEPLSKFTFSYIVTISLKQEVQSYFSQIYSQYRSLIYLLLIVAFVVAILYIYIKVFR